MSTEARMDFPPRLLAHFPQLFQKPSLEVKWNAGQMQRHTVTQTATGPPKLTYLLWCKSASKACLDTKWYSTPSFSWLFRGLVVSLKERRKTGQTDVRSQWAGTAASLWLHWVHYWFVYKPTISIHSVSLCQAPGPPQVHPWFACRQREASHFAGEGTES